MGALKYWSNSRSEGKQDVEKIKSGCTKCVAGDSGVSVNVTKRRGLKFTEAPLYLKFNPHITGGYRNSLTPKECVKRLVCLFCTV